MNANLSFATVLTLAAMAMPASGRGDDQAAAPHRVRSLRILVLSTMLADSGIGEWGFAALVEADASRFLFDTGAHPETVLQNARELAVDLASIRDVILSHDHADHTGGLLTLRRELRKQNPDALSRAHTGTGMFWHRRASGEGEESNPMLATKPDYEALGGTFIEHEGPVQLAPGVWLTGPVPRAHPERNWSGAGQVKQPDAAGDGWVEDTVPEDQSLVIDTDQGLVVLSGCGHAGVVNTLEYARRVVRAAPIHAAVGGFHLFAADDTALDWTAAQLRELGLHNLMGAHCTGIEAVYRLRTKVGLTRASCVVGAVGASFTLGQGFDPRRLAK